MTTNYLFSQIISLNYKMSVVAADVARLKAATHKIVETYNAWSAANPIGETYDVSTVPFFVMSFGVGKDSVGGSLMTGPKAFGEALNHIVASDNNIDAPKTYSLSTNPGYDKYTMGEVISDEKSPVFALLVDGDIVPNGYDLYFINRKEDTIDDDGTHHYREFLLMHDVNDTTINRTEDYDFYKVDELDKCGVAVKAYIPTGLDSYAWIDVRKKGLSFFETAKKIEDEKNPFLELIPVFEDIIKRKGNIIIHNDTWWETVSRVYPITNPDNVDNIPVKNMFMENFGWFGNMISNLSSIENIWFICRIDPEQRLSGIMNWKTGFGKVIKLPYENMDSYAQPYVHAREMQIEKGFHKESGVYKSSLGEAIIMAKQILNKNRTNFLKVENFVTGGKRRTIRRKSRTRKNTHNRKLRKTIRRK